MIVVAEGWVALATVRKPADVDHPTVSLAAFRRVVVEANVSAIIRLP